MESATFQERVKYWYRVWYSDGQMQPIHVKYQFLGQIQFLYTQKYLQWYPFAHVPHSTWHWTCSDPSARSCSAKSTEREIKRCLALKPEMRTGMKTRVVFNTFVWYLSDVWLVYTLSYLIIHNLFGSIVLFKAEYVCCAKCEQMMTEKCHANQSPWTAVQPYQQSTIWPRLKCALATIERKAGKLRLHTPS